MRIAERIAQYFPMSPTAQQLEAFRRLEAFLNHSGPGRACFVLKGYAGTGKTTIISALVRVLPALNMRAVLLAPTGRAAKVMRSYASRRALTVHKKIYRKKKALTPDLAFSLADNPHTNTVFIVDEASMITNERVVFHGRSLLDDLITYVGQGEHCRLMFVGDTAQLPPVGLRESPALDTAGLAAAYGLTTFGYELTEVVRQEAHSGILYNATAVRRLIQENGDGVSILPFPQLSVRRFPDIFRMTGERLIEGLHYAYDKYGMENTIVVCRSNRSANLYNQHIRNRILFRDEELSGGDLIMVVRNNYHWMTAETGRDGFIANGDMARIRRVRNMHEQHGFRFADVVLEFLDNDDDGPLECRVLLDTLYSDAPSLPQADQQRLYEAVLTDYGDIADRQERLQALREDPYYNALQIKFAMAVTCHKAQGGQWDAVFVDQGYLTDERMDLEFLRWLYTALTRATRELFLVNFNDQFFAGGADASASVEE